MKLHKFLLLIIIVLLLLTLSSRYTGYFVKRKRLEKVGPRLRELALSNPEKKVKVIVWLDKDTYYYSRFYREGKTPDGVKAPTNRIFLRSGEREEMIFGEGVQTSYFIGLGASTDLSKALVTVSYGWTKSIIYGGNLHKPNNWHVIYDAKGYPSHPVDYTRNQYLVISYENEGLGKILAIDENGEKSILVNEQKFPLQNAVVVGDKIIAHYLVHASSMLKMFDMQGKEITEFKFDVAGSISTMHSNGREVVFKFETFFVPYRIYSLRDTQLVLLDSEEINGDYIIDEDFTESSDGTKIHLFIVRKEKTEINNVVLYGYGGFRIAITPSYSPYILPFIEDGGVYAVANLRGGSEYGEKWHRAGMRENKQNVFNDFISAANYFKAKKARVIVIGRSNGGLLVGAVLTQKPEILDGAVIGYPVLDMLRFHKLYIGRAWVPEYGDPDNPEDAKFLLKYSPYHNIRSDVIYPPTLVYTGLHDDRVHPAHAFKFVAKMRDTGANIYLRTETVSGHAGATPETRIKEYSDILAFIYRVLGMKY